MAFLFSDGLGAARHEIGHTVLDPDVQRLFKLQDLEHIAKPTDVKVHIMHTTLLKHIRRQVGVVPMKGQDRDQDAVVEEIDQCLAAAAAVVVERV